MVPATYAQRDFVRSRRPDELWGDRSDAWRQVGLYTGQILKGTKPADLPVMQSTKFEFVINPETARTLGLTFRLPCSRSPTR